MAKKQAPATTTLTRADRINALVARLAPKAAAAQLKTGKWPGGQAPHVLETRHDTSRRLKITGDDGDVLSGVGATIDEAIAALEAKVR